MKWNQNFYFPVCKARNDQKVAIKLFSTLTKQAFCCLQLDSTTPQDPGNFCQIRWENQGLNISIDPVHQCKTTALV